MVYFDYNLEKSKKCNAFFENFCKSCIFLHFYPQKFFLNHKRSEICNHLFFLFNITFNISFKIITENDSPTTMSQREIERFSSFNTPAKGVNAISERSPKPKIKEKIIILFLNNFDLKIEHSVLAEIKKNNCKRFNV